MFEARHLYSCLKRSSFRISAMESSMMLIALVSLVCADVLQETDTKTGLAPQEIGYGHICLRKMDKGVKRRQGELAGCDEELIPGEHERKKEDCIEAYRTQCNANRFNKAALEFLSQSCLSEKFCTSQEWICLRLPYMPNHWLEIV